MTLDALIMLAGALVALLPFSGFPSSWDRVFYLLLGFFIVVLGVIVRRRSTSSSRNSQSHAFQENAPRHDEVAH